MRADAPGARIVIYGDFEVEIEERGAASSAGVRAEPARRGRPPPHRQQVRTTSSSRYAGATLTAYLDGERSRAAPKTLRDDDHGRADRRAHSRRRQRRLRRARDLRQGARRRHDRRPTSRSPATPRPRTARRPSRRSRRPQRRDDHHAAGAEGPRGRAAGRRRSTCRCACSRAARPSSRASSTRSNGAWNAGAVVPADRRPDARGHARPTRPATSARRRRTFTVANQAPTAALEPRQDERRAAARPSSPPATGTDADGDPLTYRIDFGDGARGQRRHRRAHLHPRGHVHRAR